MYKTTENLAFLTQTAIRQQRTLERQGTDIKYDIKKAGQNSKTRQKF